MGDFPGNPPSDVLFKYRGLLSLVANKDEARNRPWVFRHRSDLNQAGGDVSNPPPHLEEFTPYVLQYRYEGDFLDPNGGQTRGAVLSFMEEYVIQK